MKSLFFLSLVFLFPSLLFAQQKDSSSYFSDSLKGIKMLDEVVVEAFHSRLEWKAVPAAVAIIGSKEMERYANTSFVPVLNAVPGVRMEERSPASYRLSLRGSLLRSPFGVRNVKVYWNDIPLTDGGGNTYINLVDMNDITGAEIIKGPVASIYGAGTGGAVLLKSQLLYSDSTQNHFNTALGGGSFGLFTEQAGWQYSEKHFASSLQQTHQQADGYREQSGSRKDVIKWQSNVQLKKNELQFLIFYTDLYYQTPGGLTLAQFQQDPKLARPTAGAIPGSVAQHAAIYNKTVFGAVHDDAALSDHWNLKSFVMGNHTSFTNPFITNYEKRGEANIGAGTNLTYHDQHVQWTTGAEWLYNHALISDFGNRGGVADTVQFKDDIYATQWFAFSQLQYSVDEWVFTAGLSLNNQSFRYKRITDPNPSFVHKNIDLVLTPRLAVLYRLNRDVSLYALAAKGFSPPAVAEVRPSDGNYYGNLNAEYGWNYEAGIKGELMENRFHFDVAAYFFHLQNAIVRRTNAAGAEYFVNAGGTQQDGIEAALKYQFITSTHSFVSGLSVWSSYSYQPYTFQSYQQSGIDYSGNHLTGVPRNIWVSGIDMETKNGFYLNASVNVVSSLPLTDANDAFADAYQLVQAKIGYKHSNGKKQWQVFAGIDNVLNQSYSLGNDINAVGKRYYNAATGRNVFAGLQYAF